MWASGIVPRVAGFIARHPRLSRILFNRLFQSGKGPREHNSLLEVAVGTIQPGRALDVTMGQGRNAVFLALRGWDVTGFDVSDEALSGTAESARRSGVSIQTVQSTSAAFDYGTDRWDLLLLFYAWVPISDPAFAARLKQSLRSGGLLVFEHFLHDGPAAAPKAAGAPDPGELSKLFAGFEFLRYEEVKGVPDWEPPLRESEPPRLVRMIARKPAGLEAGASPHAPE